MCFEKQEQYVQWSNFAISFSIVLFCVIQRNYPVANIWWNNCVFQALNTFWWMLDWIYVFFKVEYTRQWSRLVEVNWEFNKDCCCWLHAQRDCTLHCYCSVVLFADLYNLHFYNWISRVQTGQNLENNDHAGSFWQNMLNTPVYKQNGNESLIGI